MEDAGHGQAAGEVAVDVDVGRVEHVQTFVIELTVVPPSLIESMAMCECSSTMPGRDELAGRVDDLGAGGDFEIRADGRDPAVADNHGSVRNRAARHREHGSALDDQRRGGRLRRLRLSALAAHDLAGEPERGHQPEDRHARRTKKN